MGVNPAYVNDDLPRFHMWMEGTGSYAKLDTRGDESGYQLTDVYKRQMQIRLGAGEGGYAVIDGSSNGNNATLTSAITGTGGLKIISDVEMCIRDRTKRHGQAVAAASLPALS